MITGIGLDTIEINRVEEKISKDGHFAERIFSPLEIAYCNSQNNPAQHYAVRFAAKEAFLKAAGIGLTLSFNLSDIEVCNDVAGKPVISLKGDFENLRKEKDWREIHLSLSHTRTDATAIVIIEQ